MWSNYRRAATWHRLPADIPSTRYRCRNCVRSRTVALALCAGNPIASDRQCRDVLPAEESARWLSRMERLRHKPRGIRCGSKPECASRLARSCDKSFSASPRTRHVGSRPYRGGTRSLRRTRRSDHGSTRTSIAPIGDNASNFKRGVSKHRTAKSCGQT